MGPRACPLAFDFYLCRIMPRPCISARYPADCCANYGTQLFHPAEDLISQARSPNAVPRRHASPRTRKRSALGTTRAAPGGTNTQNSLVIRALSEYVLAHCTPANPCRTWQTYHIIVIDIVVGGREPDVAQAITHPLTCLEEAWP